MREITVFGAGTMGNGIAHIFAQYGYLVNLIDSDKSGLNKGFETIKMNLDRQVKKGTISDTLKLETISRISLIDTIDYKIKDSDLFIEAIYEDKASKILLYSKILDIMKADSIIATNTSSISITELAPMQIADRFIGMHFMNPVPLMKLVEIIRGYITSEVTFKIIEELTLKIEKTPVEVYDYPGFISNRVLMPMINEAIFCKMENVASSEDIDTVMKLGMNHPMGPLQLADFIGLDVCLNILNVLYNGFKDTKYRPCPLLVKMVAANKLGRKTGEGFYKY